jgi:hypothetical protein
MNTLLATGVAALAAVTVAGGAACAADIALNCEAPKILIGEPEKPGSPWHVVSTIVNYNASGWQIEHHHANGEVSLRALQYQLADDSNAQRLAWIGTRPDKPTLTMTGDIERG